MRFSKYLAKKLHIMVIRDARQSVFRFRIHYFLAYLLGILIISFIIFTYTISSLHSETYISLLNFKNKLDIANKNLNDVTRSKTETINNLQNDIVQLSNQTQLLKSKMEEMMKNEEYLRSIVLNDKPSNSNLKYSNNININDVPSDMVSAIGGESYPASTDEIISLADTTFSQNEELLTQLDELDGKLNKNIENAEEKIRMWAITPSIWPSYSYKITSRFGYRKDPFTGMSSFHSGIDFSGDIGDSVFSAADGVVVKAFTDLTHGRNIIIQHYQGMMTRYLHLSKIKVNVGDKVTKGQLIGLIGNTGRSTGPHLHYEVIKNGVPINPAPYLKESREAALNVREKKEIRP